MALMHHNKLRVNAVAPDDSDAMDVYRDSGWASGPHKDTDRDDPSPIPRVLEPVVDDAADEEPADKAPSKNRK